MRQSKYKQTIKTLKSVKPVPILKMIFTIVELTLKIRETITVIRLYRRRVHLVPFQDISYLLKNNSFSTVA